MMMKERKWRRAHRYRIRNVSDSPSLFLHLIFAPNHPMSSIVVSSSDEKGTKHHFVSLGVQGGCKKR